MIWRISILIFCVSILSSSFGQTSLRSFCLDERVRFSEELESPILNIDLCLGDLEEDPDAEIVSVNNTYDRIYNIDQIPSLDSVFLLTNANTDELIIVRFENGFTEEPTLVSLQTDDPLGDAPSASSTIKVGSNFFTFVSHELSFNLLRLDNGTDLEQVNSTVYDLTLATGATARDGVRVIEDEFNTFKVFALHNEVVSVLDLGSDISSNGTLSNFTISGSQRLWGIDLMRYNERWYGLATSFLQSKVYHLDFGTALTNTPTVNELESPSAGFYGDIIIINDGSNIFGFVQTVNGSLIRYNFGENLSSLLPAVDVISNSGVVKVNSTGLEIAKLSSTYFAFSTSFSFDEIYLRTFEKQCADLPTSFILDPTEITSFDLIQNKPVTIDLGSTILEDTLRVNPSIAPSILFTSDNRCISSSNIFSAITPGLTYSWDFDADGMEDSDQENPSVDFSLIGGTGTYTVRLDVSDGTCNNFFEQEITIYDPPPAPAYAYTSARSCINAEFTFTNNTVDAGYTGPLEYLWEFIDEPSGMVVATANTKDAVYAFPSEGQKTVRLTSSIPGCTEVTEQTLMITPGPTANFFAASVCQNEAMQFTNTSTDATSYSWDFGDGFMSTSMNPSHIFNGAGNFFVTLTALDSEGCEDTEVIEVAISDSPQINFDFDILCTSSNGIQFMDLTTVDNADLVSWTWFVDDVQVSTDQSPQINFSTRGIKNIRLDVQSSNGCESSYSEDVEVLDSPTPDFNVSLGCQGEPSIFTDNTTSVGNSIVSWLWTVEGVNYGTQDISHVFTNAGNFDVTLEVTGQNFCSETITRSVEVIELPEVLFVIEGECDNQLIRAQDQSSSSLDPVIARRWMLDGASVGNGTQLVLSNLVNDTYDLALELETQQGCVISSSQTLVINTAPEASFSSSRTFGIPNDQLTFTNTSIGGITYQWLLNGESISTDPQSETILFPNAGMHIVDLIAQNSLGCNDTTRQEILIATPEVDLAIGNFELVSENNVGKIFLEVQNLSNLPVEVIEAQVVLENTFAISEQIVSFIDVGASELISLNVGIPLNVSEPSYFCVRLSSPYEDFADIEPVNNEKCITIDPVITVEDPFPNPVVDQFRLKLIVNESSTAKVSLINSAGKVQISSVQNVTSGLNNFFIDMSVLDPGIYYVVVEVLGTTHKRKVIKL